jgi:hypothetical protein
MKLKLIVSAACFCTVSAAAPAFAEDLVFMLDNTSSTGINEFYASPVEVRGWEEDILGQDVLPSGDAVRITIADGRTVCDYDLRIVFDDGEVLEDAGVNLCDTGSYTVSD